MCNGARGQLPFLKQLGLVFTNVSRAQAIRRAVESSREIFDYADVEACGIFRIITTLEFLQHHFSEMGHRDLLVTQNLSQPSSNHCSVRLTRSVRRRAASFSQATRKLRCVLGAGSIQLPDGRLSIRNLACHWPKAAVPIAGALSPGCSIES